MTLAELLRMADGRLRSQWQQTAEILTVLYNVNRDTKRRREPFTADDFNPYAAHAPVPKLKDLSILKQLFVDQQRPKGV